VRSSQFAEFQSAADAAFAFRMLSRDPGWPQMPHYVQAVASLLAAERGD
jgi:hypothetical protein